MRQQLDRFGTQQIAVIGDVMLDCYIAGEVHRVSPEAPVPVVHVDREQAVPGGAANVAANLAALGVPVQLVGVVGDDAERDTLKAALGVMGEVGCEGLLSVEGRRTTRKLRIIGGHQQIVRVDYENLAPLVPSHERELAELAAAAVDACDVVVLSDYGKGALTPALIRSVLDTSASAGKPVIVDPKRSDLAAYRGASVLTPNRHELSQATGMACETDAEATLAAACAREQCGAEILLTRSEKGLSFFPLDGAPIHLPTVAQDVYDVSGAGDTVLAAFAAATAAGMVPHEAMRLANHAAGIVVSKLGTATVSRRELIESLRQQQIEIEPVDGRLLSLAEVRRLRQAWEDQALTVGIANGCFDLLHPGHVSLLRQAANRCDRLIVALNSDASVRRIKGSGRPVQNEQARAEVIGSIKGVAAVILFDEDTPAALIEALQPDLLVKGADYSLDRVVGREIVEGRGGSVVLVELTEGHSTSSIIDRLEQASGHSRFDKQAAAG